MPRINDTVPHNGPCIELGNFYRAGFTKFTVNVLNTYNGGFNVSGEQILNENSIVSYSSVGYGDATGTAEIILGHLW